MIDREAGSTGMFDVAPAPAPANTRDLARPIMSRGVLQGGVAVTRRAAASMEYSHREAWGYGKLCLARRLVGYKALS